MEKRKRKKNPASELISSLSNRQQQLCRLGHVSVAGVEGLRALLHRKAHGHELRELLVTLIHSRPGNRAEIPLLLAFHLRRKGGGRPVEPTFLVAVFAEHPLQEFMQHVLRNGGHVHNPVPRKSRVVQKAAEVCLLQHAAHQNVEVLRGLLQRGLVKLKQFPCLHFGVQVEGVDIGVLQHLPVLDNLFHGLDDVLRVYLESLLHLLCFLRGPLHVIFIECLGLVVSKVPLIVKHIPLQLLPSFSTGLLLFLLLAWIIQVAFVPRRSMLGPRTQADPAKFMATFRASHVIAAVIFLDRRLALWAGLCVA
eukprot:RCo034999